MSGVPEGQWPPPPSPGEDWAFGVIRDVSEMLKRVVDRA